MSAKFNQKICKCHGLCRFAPFACVLVCLLLVAKPVSPGWQKWLLICINLCPHIKFTHMIKQFNFLLFKIWIKISFPIFWFFHHFSQDYCLQNENIQLTSLSEKKSKANALICPIQSHTWLQQKHSCQKKIIIYNSHIISS